MARGTNAAAHNETDETDTLQQRTGVGVIIMPV